MKNKGNEKKVFRRAQDIMDHYEMSRPAFDKFIKMGMPARLIDGSWHAHADNIDQWFKQITAVSMKDAPEGVD